MLGKRPVALIFATPQPCQSRVCGPVVDVGVSTQTSWWMKAMSSPYLASICSNQVEGCARRSKAFNLPTEPWLFTFDADGRVAARLEGLFGVRAFEGAVKAALQ